MRFPSPRLLLALFALLALGLGAVATAAPAQDGVLDSRLRYLLARRDQGSPRTASADPERVAVSIRFAAPPSPAVLREAEARGAAFRPADRPPSRGQRGARNLDGRWLWATRTVFPARVAWEDLARLSRSPGVLRVETAWGPTRHAPLFQTRALSGAEDAWDLGDGQGGLLVGDGVIIADIDSGVDTYHPDFWAADGASVDWIDVDESGGWSEGDAVDVNANGQADAGEALRWLDAPGNAPGMNAGLQPAIDHFYQDLDGDGSRDFGAGFTESDPTFGEPVYRVDDANGNGILDVGETLVALASPKVLAVYQTDATVRRAGVDLHLNEGDTYGHGTQVASIHAGGEPGRWFGGLAPGARLLLGNILYGDAFALTPMEERMAWAAAEGADVMIHEIGGWVWEFLDGSSNVETMIDELAADGIVQIVPAGNLTTGGMHWQAELGISPGDSLVTDLVAVSPASPPISQIYGDFYTVPAPGDSFAVELRTPADDTVTLGGAGEIVVVGDYEIFHATDVSPRGTLRVDFQIGSSVGIPPASLDGTWRFTLRRVATGAPAAPLTIHAMCVDDISGWFGYSTWADAVADNTVTWPATADSAVTVAAYNPNTGVLNSFSGRGLRVDGHDLVDLAAPGSITSTAIRQQDRAGVAGGYGAFGGTSAAGPHVAAAAALLLQWDPQASPARIRELLRLGAVQDAQTGATPNSAWGAGKLQVYESLLAGLTAASPPSGAPARGVTLHPNVPNPFNPVTEIRYSLPRAGDVVVSLFDLRGRLVRELQRGPQAAGEHRLSWNGRDARGRAVSSGVYLVQVTLENRIASRKITLVE